MKSVKKYRCPDPQCDFISPFPGICPCEMHTGKPFELVEIVEEVDNRVFRTLVPGEVILSTDKTIRMDENGTTIIDTAIEAGNDYDPTDMLMHLRLIKNWEE